MEKNIIIGAGVSGLSCGYVLKNNCVLLEKDNIAGGLSKTIVFRGFRFDLGGHRFLTKNKSLEKLIRNLIKEDLLEVKRKSKIFYNNRLIDYPLKASVLFQLSPVGVSKVFFTYFLRKLFPARGMSFSEIAKNRFGDELYMMFFKNYTEKVWGIKCSELSSELAGMRLQDVSLKNVLIHALFLRRKSIKSFTDLFLYPKKGIGGIAERLSKDLDIKFNSEVTGITFDNDNRIKKVIINKSEEFKCENLISTMPITDLTRLLNPPDEIKEALKQLKYRSLICVFLIVKKIRYTENHWIYFPDGQIFGRLHEPKNWSPCMSRDDMTGICVEIFCDKEDSIWKLTDSEIAAQAIKGLPFLKPSEVGEYFVKRLGYAYPIYDINYDKNLQKILNFLALYKNLFVLGRTGSFRYINMDACIEEGMRLGLSLAG